MSPTWSPRLNFSKSLLVPEAHWCCSAIRVSSMELRLGPWALVPGSSFSDSTHRSNQVTDGTPGLSPLGPSQNPETIAGRTSGKQIAALGSTALLFVGSCKVGPPEWCWNADVEWISFMSDTEQVQDTGLPRVHCLTVCFSHVFGLTPWLSPSRVWRQYCPWSQLLKSVCLCTGWQNSFTLYTSHPICPGESPTPAQVPYDLADSPLEVVATVFLWAFEIKTTAPQHQLPFWLTFFPASDWGGCALPGWL